MKRPSPKATVPNGNPDASVSPTLARDASVSGLEGQGGGIHLPAPVPPHRQMSYSGCTLSEVAGPPSTPPQPEKQAPFVTSGTPQPPPELVAHDAAPVSSSAGLNDAHGLPSSGAHSDAAHASTPASDDAIREARRARARQIIEAQRRETRTTKPTASFEQLVRSEAPSPVAPSAAELEQEGARILAEAQLRLEQKRALLPKKPRRAVQYRLDPARQGDLFTGKAEPLYEDLVDAIVASSPQPAPDVEVASAQLSLLPVPQLGFWDMRHLENTAGLSSHDRQTLIAAGETGSIYVDQDADVMNGWETHKKTHHEAQSTGEWTGGGLYGFVKREHRIRDELQRLTPGKAALKLWVAHDAVQGACSDVRIGFYDRNAKDRDNSGNSGGRFCGLVRGESYGGSGARKVLEHPSVHNESQAWAREQDSRLLKPGETFVTDLGRKFRSTKKEIEIELRGWMRLNRSTYEEELRCPLVQRMIARLESYGRRKNLVGAYVRRIKKMGNDARLRSRRAQEILIHGLAKHRQSKPLEFFSASVAWSHRERDRARKGLKCFICQGTGYKYRYSPPKVWTKEKLPPAFDVKCKRCKGTGTFFPYMPARRLPTIEYALYDVLPPKRRRFFDRLKQLFLEHRASSSSKKDRDSTASSDLRSSLSEKLFSNEWEGEQKASPSGRASPPHAQSVATEPRKRSKEPAPRGGRREAVVSVSSPEGIPAKQPSTGRVSDSAIEGRGRDHPRARVSRALARSQESERHAEQRRAQSDEAALLEALQILDSDPALGERLSTALELGPVVRARLRRDALAQVSLDAPIELPPAHIEPRRLKSPTSSTSQRSPEFGPKGNPQ